jgi:hypothetical protein
MEMTNYNSFDIFDIISGGLDSRRQSMDIGIFDSREDVRDWSGPFL